MEAELLYPAQGPGSHSAPMLGGVSKAKLATNATQTSPKVTPTSAQHQRIDMNRMSFSAMRYNPVYALFVLTIVYWLYRILVTILYPVVRPPMVGIVTVIHNQMDKPNASPFLTFLYTLLDLIHRLFERVIYPIVCVQILDRVFVVILVVILCMFAVWLVWKYTLVWPIKDIVGAILQATPPFSWFWGFFDELERVIFGTNSDRLQALALFITSGTVLIGDEAQAQMDGSVGGDTTTAFNSVGGDPTQPALSDNAATLQSTTSKCSAQFSPYAFTDPFSQIMVRTELTKCNLDGLEAYYRAVEPDVADKMAQCRSDPLFSAEIPQAEFVPTDGLVAVLAAPKNTVVIDASGQKLVKNANGVLVARQATDSVMAVLDASGNALGYLNAQRQRVVPAAEGGFAPMSDNLAQTLKALKLRYQFQYGSTEAGGGGTLTSQGLLKPHDPIRDLLSGDASYLNCRIAALKTAKAVVAVELDSCADGEATVPDPALSATDVSGSYTNLKQFASDSSASQARVSTCHNTQGTKLAKRD